MEGGILSPAVLGVEMLPPGDVPTASQQDVEEYIYIFFVTCSMCFSCTEMDDEDCERRRMECLDEMTTLEKQFTDLKEQ